MQRFFFLILSPLFLTAVYDLIFYVQSAKKYDELSDFFYEYLVVQPFAFLFLWIILSFITFRKGKKKELIVIPSKMIIVFAYAALFVLSGALYIYLFYSVFGNFYFFDIFENFGKFYAQSRIGTAWVIFLMQICIFFMVYDMFMSGFAKYKLAIFFLCLFMLIMTGGRTLAIIIIAMMFYVRLVVHGGKVPRKIIVASVAIFLAVFFINTVYRSGAENIAEYIGSKSSSMDFDNSKVFADSLRYERNNNHEILVSLEDFMYMFVPRRLYKEKPVSTAETRMVYSEMLEDGRTTNITFGIYGNLVVNLSAYSLFLAPMLVVLLGFIYHLYFCKGAKLKVGSFFLMTMFLFYPLVLRGGFINARIFLIFILIVIAVAIWHALLLFPRRCRKAVTIRS